MKCSQSVISFMLLFFLVTSLKGQDNKLKASYIFSFAQYVEWPKEYSEGNFIVGFLGESELENELRELLLNRTINNQNASVKKFNAINDLSRCHVLIIANNATNLTKEILEKLKPYNTLVITEKEGMSRKNSGISFITKDEKLSFDLNRKNITDKGLRIDNQFTTLAANVY